MTMANAKAGDRRPGLVNNAECRTGKLDVETKRRQCADIGAPMPKNAIWPRLSWPVKPSSRLRLIAPMMKMPVVINAFSR